MALAPQQDAKDIIVALKRLWITIISDLTGDRVVSDLAWGWLDEIIAHYSEPHRGHHGLAHPLFVANRLQDWCYGWAEPLLAAFTHDVIYQPGASDNEEFSAAFTRAGGERVGIPEFSIQSVEGMVLASKKHEPVDAETNAFLDADDAILGVPWQRYQQYAAGIRFEYSAYSDEEFRAGRRAFLESMLARDRIFLTPMGYQGYEKPARGNMQRELASL